MEKLVRRVSAKKTDKKSINSYIKCFVSNEKAKELFKSSRMFSDVRNYITTKKVS